jgi:hypothetical protein
MIAYNKEWLDALLTRDTARPWFKRGLLSAESWKAVEERHRPGFYTPNLFVRIGLAIFCLILLMAVMGLGMLFFEPDTDAGMAAFGLFWGAVFVAALDFWVIGSGRHYASGIDDMLLYVATGCIISSLFTLLPSDAPPLVYAIVAWPFLVAGALRYTDRLMAAAAYLCTLIVALLLINEIPRLALYLLPFGGLAFSAAAWMLARREHERFDRRHWHGLLSVVELLALITFYVSGNYWVVQQAGLYWFGLERPPLPWFFWAFTYGVPVAYVVFGLRRKDRWMLDCGLAGLAAAVFTYRYYFHVLPLAWAAALAGAVMFSLAYFSIRYLRKKDSGYTYEPDDERSEFQELKEQAIQQVISSQTVTAPQGAPKNGFGGGQFGGGGAGNDF